MLEDFAAPDEVAKLKERAEQIIEDYDASKPSIFSTVNQASIFFAQLSAIHAARPLHATAAHKEPAQVMHALVCCTWCSDHSTSFALQKFRTDNQFLDSANGISVFLEEKAMDADNRQAQWWH